jgi:thiol-disulfide isomerase/thioredoxin
MKEKLIVFKFWAAWCGPCRVFAPIFEKASKDKTNSERFNFREIDSDDDANEDLIMNFNVRNLPTIIIYDQCNNKIIARKSMLMSQEVFQKWLDEGYKKYEEMTHVSQ